MLSKERILAACSNADSLQLDVFEQIDSTNEYGLGLAPLKAPFHFCIADQQTAGKAQRGKTWLSPAGQNLYCTCSWETTLPVEQLGGLSLVVGLAIIEALKLPELKIKWPNDIYWHDKKCVGILVETKLVGDKLRVVMGMGINVNMTQAAVDQPWTSLQQITAMEFDRNRIAAALIDTLPRYCEQFAKTGFEHFQSTWKPVDYLNGKTITLVHGKTQTTGQVEGVNAHGHLQLKTQEGAIKTFASGSIQKAS